LAAFTLISTAGAFAAEASDDPLDGVATSQFPPESVEVVTVQGMTPVPMFRTAKVCGETIPPCEIAVNERPLCESRIAWSSVLMVIVTGMVAGLGTITPASGFVGPMGALAIGLAAGLLCFIATNYMKRALGVDDSLDVFPVHGVGGILGTTLTGVFASSLFGGMGYPEGQTMAGQVAVQLGGVLVTLVWSGILTWVLLKISDAVAGMRVAGEEETEGLDTVLHNEKGYNL